MAVVEKESIMTRLNELIGDRTDDEAISIVEDVSDTIDSASGKGMVSEEEANRRVAEKEKEWRKKYKERFFSGEPAGEDKNEPENKVQEAPEKTEPRFEDLFKEVKE